jgi:hypothetical protein
MPLWTHQIDALEPAAAAIAKWRLFGRQTENTD